MTITEIEQHEIVGNAYHDGELMASIDKFVKQGNPIDEKIRALRKLDQVMGIDSGEITEQDVRDYILENC